MATVSLVLLAFLPVSTVTSSGFLARNKSQPHATCDPTLFGKDGFDICLLDKSTNTESTLLAILGNPDFAVQNALGIAKCICNQNCHPSQIVCKDGKLVELGLLATHLAGHQGLIETLTQIIYQTENYQFYCFCPSLVSAKDACKPVDNPQKCEYPHSRS